jgi:hypothetical protein
MTVLSQSALCLHCAEWRMCVPSLLSLPRVNWYACMQVCIVYEYLSASVLSMSALYCVTNARAELASHVMCQLVRICYHQGMDARACDTQIHLNANRDAHANNHEDKRHTNPMLAWPRALGGGGGGPLHWAAAHPQEQSCAWHCPRDGPATQSSQSSSL